MRFPTKFSLKQFTSESVDRVAEGLPALDYTTMNRSGLKNKLCVKSHKHRANNELNNPQKPDHLHVEDLEIFNLYGFVIHEGERTRKGHYTCVVKGLDD